MPLAEYLASEQAREDVRELLSGTKRAISAAAGSYVVLKDTEGVWAQVCAFDDDDDDSSALAYYRPDGDRYVVTDLGEGVRALRLRTGQPIEGWQSWCDGIVDSTAGVIRKQDVKADQLPDALCRVMLASLRVAQS